MRTRALLSVALVLSTASGAEAGFWGRLGRELKRPLVIWTGVVVVVGCAVWHCPPRGAQETTP